MVKVMGSYNLILDSLIEESEGLVRAFTPVDIEVFNRELIIFVPPDLEAIILCSYIFSF